MTPSLCRKNNPQRNSLKQHKQFLCSAIFLPLKFHFVPQHVHRMKMLPATKFMHTQALSFVTAKNMKKPSGCLTFLQKKSLQKSLTEQTIFVRTQKSAPGPQRHKIILTAGTIAGILPRQQTWSGAKSRYMTASL